MTLTLFGLVITAAFLHAVWNSIAKASDEPELTIASYQLVGALICMIVANWLPLPDASSWPMIIGSAIVHNFYYFSLAQAYRSGDLSQVYPIFRGAAPILVACGAAIFANEFLPMATIAGIAFISVALASLAFRSATFGAMSTKAIIWAVLTATLIAGYTIIDGIGVRVSGNPLSYIVWLFIFEIVPIGFILLITKRMEWSRYFLENRFELCAGGVASSVAYGLVIYAMSLGPMAIVSSLRETSVIFAAIIGAVYLREPFGMARIRAAVMVAIGVIIIRWFG